MSVCVCFLGVVENNWLWLWQQRRLCHQLASAMRTRICVAPPRVRVTQQVCVSARGRRVLLELGGGGPGRGGGPLRIAAHTRVAAVAAAAEFTQLNCCCSRANASQSQQVAALAARRHALLKFTRPARNSFACARLARKYHFLGGSGSVSTGAPSRLRRSAGRPIDHQVANLKVQTRRRRLLRGALHGCGGVSGGGGCSCSGTGRGTGGGNSSWRWFDGAGAPHSAAAAAMMLLLILIRTGSCSRPCVVLMDMLLIVAAAAVSQSTSQ